MFKHSVLRSPLESLERRRLLAQLVIDGTSGADTLSISISGSDVVVDLNGTISTHLDSTVTGITINMLEGDDTINIESNSNNPTTINAGAGLDIVQLAPIGKNLSQLGSQVSLNSGTNGASLSIFDSSSALNSSYTIVSGSVGRSGFGGVTFDSALSELNVIASAGANVFNVQSTPPQTSISGMGESDQCVLMGSGQNLSNLGKFDFLGGEGFDELVLFDSNRTANDAWSISSTQVWRDELAAIDYDAEALRIYQGTGDNQTLISEFSNPTLFIDGWEGNDTVTLNQVGAGVHIELTGYLGDDRFFVESSSATSQIDISGEAGVNEVSISAQSRDASMVAGAVSFVGSGSDSLWVFDDAQLDETDYQLGIETITSDAMGVVTFTGIARVELFGSRGASDYNFDATALGTSTQITPGDLADTFSITPTLGDIGTIQGEINIEESNGTDSLFVFDNQTSSSGNYDFSDVKLTGVAFADISYSVELIELHCASGDNGIIVRNQNASVKQRLFAGAGVDVIHIDESISVIELDTGEGVDRLALNDDANPNPSFAKILLDDTINTVNVGPDSILTIADNVTFRATNENLEGAMAFGHHSSYIAAAGSAALPINIARNYVFAGYNGGNWLGDFAAFRSDYSASTPIGDGIGYARAADIGLTEFKSIPVTADDVIFTQTLYGDADLNYTVNFNDLLRTAQNYSLGSRYWSQGDFDYDRSVLFPDLLLIAQNYGLSAISIVKTPASRRITGIILRSSGR